MAQIKWAEAKPCNWQWTNATGPDCVRYAESGCGLDQWTPDMGDDLLAGILDGRGICSGCGRPIVLPPDEVRP